MRKIALVSGLFLALFMISASGCEKMQPAETTEMEEAADVATQEGALEMPSPAQATVATVVVGGTPFSVEIARTDEEKAKGLSGRESLPENSGMWFVFDEPVQDKFWMQGMEVPLDIIFVDEDMKVVHVFSNAAAGSTELISSPTPYMYVLEVNAGQTEKNGINVGDEVERQVGGE